MLTVLQVGDREHVLGYIYLNNEERKIEKLDIRNEFKKNRFLFTLNPSLSMYVHYVESVDESSNTDKTQEIEPVIGFSNKPSPTILNLNTMEFDYLNAIERNHPTFMNLGCCFDYAFIENILIIPESLQKEPHQERTLSIKNLEITCYGDYILFFHFEKINNVLYATSLTLPELKFIKDNVRCKESFI